MEINEKILRFVGSASIPDKLEVGEDLTLGVNVNVYSAEVKNNEDGTGNEIYRCRPTGEVLITRKWGKPMKGRSKSSSSKQLRNAFYYLHTENNITEDLEEWRIKQMNLIIAKLPEVIEFLKSKLT